MQPLQILDQGTAHADVTQRRLSQTQNDLKKRQLGSLISGRSKDRVAPISHYNYSISAYFLLLYCRPLVVILLVIIDGYYLLFY